jgi:hypothetical protein
MPSYGTKMACKANPVAFLPQDQQPGLKLVPQPIYENPGYQGSANWLTRWPLLLVVIVELAEL